MEETDSSQVERQTLLPAKLEWFVLALCACLFICVPLFYLSIYKCANCGKEPVHYYSTISNSQTSNFDLCEECSRKPHVIDNLRNEKWERKAPPPYELLARKVFSIPVQNVVGLIAIRSVDAEYKLVVFLAFASLLSGIVICGLHLKKSCISIPKPLVIFAGLFIGSVLISSLFAHNFQRAWVSSLLWHFVPVLFAFSLANVSWNRKKIAFCLSSLLIGGIASCLIAMDQHYDWSKWDWRGLLKSPSVPAGLIYNHNFAAEYHAPLLPIALGLLFYVRSIGFRIALGLTLAFVLLPALSLSLARGAWVGLIGGCIFGLTLFLVAWLSCRRKNSDKSGNIKSFTPLWGLLSLGLALPVYIFTSHYWGDRVGLIGQSILGLALFLVAWLSCRSKYSDESANFKSFTPLWGLLALGLALPVYLSDHLGTRIGLIGGCIFGLAFFGVAWLSCRRKNSEKSASLKSFTPLWALLGLALALPVYIVNSDHWKKGAWIYHTSNGEGGSSSSPSTSPTRTFSNEAKELLSITEISEYKGGIARRLVLWQDALNACLSTDLFFGKGTDHYELHFHESAKLSDNPPFGGWVRFVHNDFIQTLYENGLLGLIGFLGIWLWIIWKAVCSCLILLWKEDLRSLGLRIGLVSGCLVFLIESFFEFPTRSPCSLMVGWACLGVLLGILLKDKKSHQGVFRLGAKMNLLFVALGILTIPHGLLVAKDLFWTKVYHVQATEIDKRGQKESALKFHRKAISHAPWEFRSRILEHYYLLNVFNQKSTGMEALEDTLRVHPGCLVAHQNKIEFYLQTNQYQKALKAHSDLGKAAPFHPTTKQVRRRIDFIKLANLETRVADGDSSQDKLEEIKRLRRRLANP